MKLILFYNQYSGPDLSLKNQVESEGLHVETVEIMTEDNPFKKYIRATPALITITDDTQGEFLQDPEVDMITYIHALIAQTQEKEERIVHKQETNRLDVMVNGEKEKSKKEAEDALTLELIEGGLL